MMIIMLQYNNFDEHKEYVVERLGDHWTADMIWAEFAAGTTIEQGQGVAFKDQLTPELLALVENSEELHFGDCYPSIKSSRDLRVSSPAVDQFDLFIEWIKHNPNYRIIDFLWITF